MKKDEASSCRTVLRQTADI